jgi:succinate dehydrogenase/fumarate reductase flavoprotein subunit
VDSNWRQPESVSFDVVVVGAGVAGLTAALVASLYGRRVLLIERSNQVGGTSARSSGTVWIPNNAQLVGHGISGDDARALAYLDALVGDRAPRELREAFVAAAPEMLAFLHARTDVRFRAYPEQPDYRPALPGAAVGWRALEPAQFDGRTLGRSFVDVGWPLPELMVFGGMMITRSEAARLLRMWRSPRSMFLALRLGLRYLRDRVRHRRGTRLVLGNALVARLFKNVIDHGATVWLDCEVTSLNRDAVRVAGLTAQRDDGETVVRARDGVILAGGGFPAGAAWRERHLPKPVAQHTSAFEGCTGSTLELGLQAGATLGEPNIDNALWFPGSVRRRRDGSTAVFPHIVLDRGKPGLIAVDRAGQRFVDEAGPYHDFVRAMYRHNASVACIPAMLVCDRRFLWKYGLGMIRPRTVFLRRYLSSGYLRAGNTIEDLAVRINVDPEGLARTVERHNGFAATGIDEDFAKGSNAYDLASGDPDHTPNPCIGRIDRPPYYAVAVEPTPLGTSLGLRTNSVAQALNAGGDPIPGLYVCGNDMHSPFGGEYPGAGAQLGLAMTCAYVAARHATTGT